ncbi:hypothetical protein HPB50_007106 [Hyalomma asiaticum]|uniref:Uncharacterized protein n=1 Tax=Hyalomma asiaticum TaxID=266040 RepID=A0ACB7RYF4_HYAAI|nr:hypothetical protein HPB50_007106 [Hyalomma asiaticum]
MSEFPWRNVLLSLPKKPRPSCHPQKVQKIGVGAIPESVEQVVGLGPKFSVDTKVGQTVLLALVCSTACRAAPVPSDRIFLECVEALLSKLSGKKRPPLASVVQCLREGDFNLLQSDKEGGFVVLVSDVYHEKAYEALQDNFREAKDFHPAKAKKMALKNVQKLAL